MANTPLNTQSIMDEINQLEQQIRNLKGNSSQNQLLRQTGATHIKMLRRRIKSAERRAERRANMTEADRLAAKKKRDERRANNKRLIALGRQYELQLAESGSDLVTRPN